MMNTSTTSSSRTTSEDRARRNAELEELRERGLARQWQQLLAEAGGSMPITMDAWLAQQRALTEEDRKRQQDASDNLHNFRGGGINDSYRSKSLEHISTQLTPDSTVRKFTIPENTLGDDDVQRQLHLDPCKDDHPKDFAKEFSVISSTPQSVDMLDIITPSGHDETNLDRIDSKCDSLEEWVEIRDDAINDELIFRDSLSGSITPDSMEIPKKNHASSQIHSDSSLLPETLSLETKYPYHYLASTSTSLSSPSNIYPFLHMNILVSFGLVTSPDSAPPHELSMDSMSNSTLIKDILDRFYVLLEKEPDKQPFFCKLKERPYVVSTEKDANFLSSSVRTRCVVKVNIPLVLGKQHELEEVSNIRKYVCTILSSIFAS